MPDNFKLMIALLISAIIILILAVILAFRAGQRVESIERRLAALEQAQPKAHTHRTIAGIEDAQAVAIDLVFTTQELEARLDNLRTILGSVRQGPHSYDPDRPAGKRVERS